MASNAAGKRRYAQEKAANSIVQTAPICKFPTNIMLHIFMFLDMKSLCASSKVCRQWYHFVSDRSLWKVVNLKKWPLALRTLWKVVNNRLTDSVTELHIRGFLGTTKKNQKNISPSLLAEVKIKCPNLEMLSLCYCDLRKVDMRFIPEGLKSLCLDKSIIPLGWFESLKRNLHFPNLLDLDLTSCTRLSNTDLECVARIISLEQLNLSNCYRIEDSGIIEIAASLRSLIKLDLSKCTRITNLTLHHVGRHLTKLKSLTLVSCELITDAGISSLVHSLRVLQHLDLSSCSHFTDNGLSSIVESCKNLRELNLSGCFRVTEEGIDFAKTSLTQCEIQGPGLQHLTL